MWWFFGFYDISILFFIFRQLLDLLRLDAIFYRFILLGLLPGTNFRITFNEMILVIWMLFFIVIVYKLFFRTQKILLQIDPLKNLPKNFAIYYIFASKN